MTPDTKEAILDRTSRSSIRTTTVGRLAACKQLPPSDHGFMEIIRTSRAICWTSSSPIRGAATTLATVFVECGAMYRAYGPEAYRGVGETEFVNGAAAMSASGVYGESAPARGSWATPTCPWATRWPRCSARTLRRATAASAASAIGAYDADPEVLGPLAGGPAGST